MLIDDSGIDNYVNEKTIIKSGFARNVIVCDNAPIALKYLRSAGSQEKPIPDIIFLDLNMPVFDGRQFLAEYRSLSVRVREISRIVVLSSSMNPMDMQLAVKDPNVKVFLSKPLIGRNLDVLERELFTEYATRPLSEAV